MVVEFGIKRVDDRTLYRVFKAAYDAGQEALKLEESSPQNLNGQNHKIDISFSSDLPWVIAESELDDAPSGQFLVKEAYIKFTSNPQGQGQAVGSIVFSLTRSGANSLTDRFLINGGSHTELLRGAGEQAVQKAIDKKLSILLRPVVPEDGGLVPTLSNLAEGFNTTYQRISEELSAAMAAVSKERADQLTEFQDERKRLRDEIATERSAMQEEAKREFGTRQSELEAEKQKLQAEWAKLEISSHKDARRKQFAALQEELQTALTAPVADRGLRTTRWAVFLALLVAGAAAGYFAFGSIAAGAALSTPGAASETWVFPAIRSVVLTVTSLASFFGAAAWLRYFYVRDLQAHEELRRFRNDMARASWVMEAALEIRKEHNEEIPPEWITGVTEGLFAVRKKDTLEEGAQALAALMGLTASASFGPGGVSVELGKKAGKALSAAAKGEG